MNSRQVIGLGLLLLAAIAAALGFAEMNEAHRLRIAVDSANRRRDRALVDDAANAKRNDWLHQHRAELAASLAKLKAAHPNAGQAKETVINWKETQASWTNPKYINLRQKAFRSRLTVQYKAFYRAIGLSPGQIARFEDLKTEAEGRRLDIALAAETLGLPEKGPEIAPLIADSQAQFNADALDLMGQATFDSYQQYESSAPERQLIAGLASSLLFTSSPLSEQQTQQLTQILAAARQSSSSGEPGALSGLNLDQVQTQAAAILAPPQVAELSSRIARARSAELTFQMMGMMRDWVQQAPDSR